MFGILGKGAYSSHGYGVIATSGSWYVLMYKAPNILSLFETNDPTSSFGANSAGEQALIPVASAVANAIYDAVGVRIKEIPFTPEKILAVLGNRQTVN